MYTMIELEEALGAVAEQYSKITASLTAIRSLLQREFPSLELPADLSFTMLGSLMLTLNQTIDDLSLQLRDAEAKSQALQKTIAEASDESLELSAKLALNDAALQKARQKMTRLEAEHASISEALLHKTEAAAEIKGQVMTLASADTLSVDVKAMQAEVAQLEHDVDSLGVRQRNLSAKHADASFVCQAAQSSAMSAARCKADLLPQVQAREAHLQGLRAQLAATQARTATLLLAHSADAGSAMASPEAKR